MFSESHLIVKSDTKELYVRIALKKVAIQYKDKAGSALIAVGDLENIMTLVFSGFSFILHLAHHLASFSRSFCRYSAAKLILFNTDI